MKQAVSAEIVALQTFSYKFLIVSNRWLVIDWELIKVNEDSN